MTGLDAPAIGDLAASRGIAVHALIPRSASLEDAYLDLTGEAADFRAASPRGRKEQPSDERDRCPRSRRIAGRPGP